MPSAKNWTKNTNIFRYLGEGKNLLIRFIQQVKVAKMSPKGGYIKANVKVETKNIPINKKWILRGSSFKYC